MATMEKSMPAISFSPLSVLSDIVIAIKLVADGELHHNHPPSDKDSPPAYTRISQIPGSDIKEPITIHPFSVPSAIAGKPQPWV